LDSPEITKKKLLAIRRAEQRLKQRLETIDWEERVLKPEVEGLKDLIGQGDLPQIRLELEG
jgi:hypothetical protein